ncbi:MAG TPA: RNA polymerase sigma factor SigJ [Rhizomicrobium sp.]
MTDIAAFEAQRAHLRSIAYRMLGEMAAAEDVVQEAWLRWCRAEGEDIRDPRAWLSAATVRLSLDALRKIRARRESYVGPWLPEPILPDDTRAFAADAPAARAELASDLSLALLHVLERLSPEERAALIMHDAFDCDYSEIAATLAKTEAACRKLVSRARERVKADRPRFSVSRDQHRDLLMRFAKASADGDTNALASLLIPDAIAYTDGGGRVAAALNPIYGADKVARFIIGLGKKFYAAAMLETSMIEINGQPALVLRDGHEMLGVIAIETDGMRITALYGLRNPDKLKRLTDSLNPSVRGSSLPAGR